MEKEIEIKNFKLMNEEGIFLIKCEYGCYYAFISISTLLKMIENEGLTIEMVEKMESENRSILFEKTTIYFNGFRKTEKGYTFSSPITDFYVIDDNINFVIVKI